MQREKQNHKTWEISFEIIFDQKELLKQRKAHVGWQSNKSIADDWIKLNNTWVELSSA